MIHQSGPLSKQSRQEQRQTTAALLAAIPNLTPAELRICLLILERKSTRDIADVLHLSQRTIENQRQSIRRKMGATGNLVVELMKVRGY
jgi:DNA-binding CsgD family transcriptional regulator